ncbi:hypothetical protein F5X98DRAFT_379179 [Xylaria grammica]|nr:hypothetical protein F5X98DRAFT_379179 [Xylaria grammica]
MSLPNRRACDRCHDHKLACKRMNNGTCERCLKANQACTSSPSLRYRKKRSWRGRESRNRGRLIQIRPGPLKVTGETLLLPQQDRRLCDLVSRSEQDPATSNPFGEPQVDKHAVHLPIPCSSGPSFPTFHSEEAYAFHHSHGFDHVDSEGLRQTSPAAEVEPEYLELCLPHSSLDGQQFQDTTWAEYAKQTLLGYLSEVDLVLDAWRALERDTTCSGTNAGSGGLKMVDDMSPSGPCIQELFQLSQRFSCTLHAMASTGMFTSCHADPEIAVLVHSRIQDIHNIIIQLATKSLQLSKNAMVWVTEGTD